MVLFIVIDVYDKSTSIFSEYSYSETKRIFLSFFVFHKSLLVFSLGSVVFMQSKQQYLLRCIKAELGSHRDHTPITLVPVAGDVAPIDSH